MNYINGMIAALFVMVIAFIVWQSMDRAPEPPFTMITTQKNISIRQYPPLAVAQIEVEGNRETAVDTGFRLLADYIFGQNVEGKKMEMIAPVIEQGIPSHPSVYAQEHKLDANKWLIQFFMPINQPIESLPKPINEAIKLTTLPAKKLIVIRFSGRGDQSSLLHQLNELDQFIAENDVKVKGEPMLAFYNPPWTIPFFKRNEIMYEMTEK
jgi:effector-binding domain-containing protein